MDIITKDFIGSKIREFRRAKGLSVPQLERLTGIDRQQIYRFEWGVREPRSTEIAKLAQALGVTPNDILVVNLPGR